MNSISCLTIFVTHKCNLKCPYCYENFNNRNDDLDDMRIPDIFKFVKRSVFKKESKIVLFGGEPFLNFDAMLKIFDFIVNGQDNVKNCIIMTNGLLITEEKLTLIKNLIPSGTNKNIMFIVSVDNLHGIKGEDLVHDKLLLIQKYGFIVNIQVVVNKSNYNNIFNIGCTLNKYITNKIIFKTLCNVSVFNKSEIDVIQSQFFKLINQLGEDRSKFTFGKDDGMGRANGMLTCAERLKNSCKCKPYTIDVNGDLYNCEKMLSYKEGCIGNVKDYDINLSKIQPNFDKFVSTKTSCPPDLYDGDDYYNKMIENISTKVKAKLSVFFEINDMCNYGCSYCCKSWRSGTYGEMSQGLLNKIASLPATSFKITGGEPGLSPKKVIAFVNSIKYTPISINTNLYNWEEIDLMYLVNSGVQLTIDIPSLNKSLYNHITNSPDDAFDKVTYNLNLLNSDNVIICIIVTEENYPTYKNDILQFATVYNFNKFNITPAISINAKFDSELFYSDMQLFIDNHKNLDIKTLSKTLDNAIPVTHECSAGLDRFVILPNGDVTPCAWSSKSAYIGNILNNDLESILHNGKKYFYSFNKSDQKICKGYLENR